MDPDYPKTCKTTIEIFAQLGFDFEVNDKGDIIELNFNGKTGAEELFMEAIGPYVEAGSYIEWKGEDEYDHYKYEFDGKEMTKRLGTVSYY